MSDLKVLGGQLKSYKGWLTQSINNCLELIKIPSSASNASSMVSRLESALGELDERRHKVESCLESMEALDFGKDDDEDKKDREKYYAAQRLQVAQKCQNAISEVYLVYTRWNTQPEESGSTSPAQVVAAGQLGGQVKVLDSLKPFVLSKDHIPREFHAWKQQFKAFFSASNLNKLTVAGQQAFFKKQLDSTLLAVLEPLITSTTPVFDDDNMPGTDSCFTHLNNEFMLRYPLVARRFEFFSQCQKKDQSFTEYLGNVKSSSALSDLGTLGVEGLIVYKTIIGLHQDYSELREKILELPQLSMSELERVSRAHESAQSAIRGISGNKYAFANLAIDDKDSDDFAAQARQISDRARTKWRSLVDAGCCPRCAKSNPDHSQKECSAAQRTCGLCNVDGHYRAACSQNNGQSRGNNGQFRGSNSQFRGTNGRSRGNFRGRQASKSPKRPPTTYKKDKTRAKFGSSHLGQSPPPKPFRKRQGSFGRSRQVTTESDHESENGDLSDDSGTSQDDGAFARTTVSFSPPSIRGSKPTPRVKIKFTLENGQTLNFSCVPDTGCTFSVVSFDILQHFHLKLKSSSEKLYTASKELMDVQGIIQLKANFKGKEAYIDALVSKSLQHEILLSWHDCERLHAATIAYKTVTAASFDSIELIKKEYSDVLRDSMSHLPMKGPPMKLYFKPNVQVVPFKVYSTASIPLHMEKEAQICLNKALKDKVIERVAPGIHCPWTFRGFFVAKPGNTTAVRMVVDLSPLNEYLDRPAHLFTPGPDLIKSIKPACLTAPIFVSWTQSMGTSRSVYINPPKKFALFSFLTVLNIVI